MVTPFSFIKTKSKKHAELGGFNKTHSKYTILNKTTVTLVDYVNCIKVMQPDFAVSPIEEVDTDVDGKKKI